MGNTLSIQEKKTLIVLLNDLLREKKAVDAGDEASVQLYTFSQIPVSFVYCADKSAQLLIIQSHTPVLSSLPEGLVWTAVPERANLSVRPEAGPSFPHNPRTRHD